MAFHCPHCKAEVPGLSQEDHVARLAAKDEENKVLKAELKSSREAVTNAATLKAERDQLRGDLDKLNRQAERSAAFTAAGVPDTAAVRKVFELVYDSEQAGQETPAKFEDWLGTDTTKGHPILSAHLAKPQTNGTTTTTTNGTTTAKTTAVKPQGGLTNIDKGSEPPPATDGPKTAAELDAYLRSPGYRALPKEKQKETVAQLKEKLSA